VTSSGLLDDGWIEGIDVIRAEQKQICIGKSQIEE
jgi:hypothetical protein